ncbi:hypothetical protein F2Q69_00010265 [Brassica cretica]|uniref:Brf1 TBP-binding domain-containing protein n=1 Tax=Brassica cretica TaxID=69181 RepID=A0A8S9QSK5_BRACR|nr:hypothetical protein F2Q69_00010265 [Brassica cretica]
MVWCKHCAKEVSGIRPDDCDLACNRCGRILENYNFSEEVTFIKNAAGQSQASARDELMNLRDALQIGDDRDDVVNMAGRLFDLTKTSPEGADLNSYSLPVSTWLAGKRALPFFLLIFQVTFEFPCFAYLQLCELIFFVDKSKLEELVDPSIFIPRFIKIFQQVSQAHIVHMCGATITKRLNEFANTEAASLTVDELNNSEKTLREKAFTPRPNSDKEVVNCKHKDSISFGYGLCEDCHVKFLEDLLVGRILLLSSEQSKREWIKQLEKKKEGGIGKSLNQEKNEGGERYWNDEASDESDNLSDLDGDPVVDGCFLDENEKRAMKESWEFLNQDWLKEQAAKEAAASEAINASNGNCPEHARNLVEASKASVAKSRKEKRQKQAEETKNAPPAATTLEATCEMSPKKPRTETVK